jgi:Bacterial Ig domain
VNITLSIPGDGSGIKGVVGVTVTVSPTKNLTQIKLLVDSTQVALSSASPLVHQWDTTKVADGQHTLKAVAVYKQRTSQATLQVTVANAGIPPSEWTQVAVESQSFTLTATKEVRYGKDTSWTSRVLAAGTYSCANSLFGDPLYGTQKVCEARSTTKPPDPLNLSAPKGPVSA